MWHILPCWGADIRFGSTIELFGAGYLKKKAEDKDTGNTFGEIKFRPYITLMPSDNLLFYIKGDFRSDSANYSHGYMDGTGDTERWAASLREAYCEYAWKWLRFRVGKLIVNWSITDTVSPGDNINPRDWTDIIEWERIGVPAADLSMGYDTFIEFVYIPWFTPSIIPKAGWRWEREMPPGVILGDQEMPDRHNAQLAVRARSIVWNTDVTTSFYKGYSFSPSQDLEPISLTLMQATPVYRKEEVYALGLAREIWWKFMVRAEVGYFDQEDEDEFVQYVLGVDRIWDGVFTGADRLYALIQYANEVETENITPPEFNITDFRRSMHNAVMVKVKHAFSDEEGWALKLEGFYNLGDKDGYVEPAIAWQTNIWEVEAGVGIAFGPDKSFMGGYKDHDRFFLRLTCIF